MTEMLYSCEYPRCDHTSSSFVMMTNHYAWHRRMKVIEEQKKQKQFMRKIHSGQRHVRRKTQNKDWGVMNGFHVALLPGKRSGKLGSYYRCNFCMNYQIKDKEYIRKHVAKCREDHNK